MWASVDYTTTLVLLFLCSLAKRFGSLYWVQSWTSANSTAAPNSPHLIVLAGQKHELLQQLYLCQQLQLLG